jgi:hypothetical protein
LLHVQAEESKNLDVTQLQVNSRHIEEEKSAPVFLDLSGFLQGPVRLSENPYGVPISTATASPDGEGASTSLENRIRKSYMSGGHKKLETIQEDNDLPLGKSSYGQFPADIK